MNDSALDDKADFEPELKKPRRNYHPWRRLFARLIDYQISGLIFTGLIFSTRLAPDFIVNPLQIQNSFQVASSWAMGFFSMALWVVLEPLILSKFNNTPGKALLRLKLVPNDEHSSYWKRSFSVWAVGLAFGIPLIETFASIIAAIRLKKRGLTDWDRWYGFRVVAYEFGFKRGLVAFALVSLVFASNVVLMSSFAWLGAKNTNQVELTKDATSTKKDDLSSTSPALSPKEKIEKLQKEAEQGDADSQFKLGSLYFYRQGGAKDHVKAFEWVQKAARQGHAGAQGELGALYQNGDGVTKDFIKAFEWYQKAADQGDVFGQFKVGVMYHNGEGVKKDVIKAIEWYQKAAEQGSEYAQFKLGNMYREGEGVVKDGVKAVEWYQKAAEQGLAEAQFALAVMYDLGEGVYKDDLKAVEWYQKAAEQGIAIAQGVLGQKYFYGQGVTKDSAKGIAWYQKAAKQGEAISMFNLALFYLNGQELNKDEVLAYAWFSLAALQGNGNAANNVSKLEKKLTVAQLSEGKNLVINWKKGDDLKSQKLKVEEEFEMLQEKAEAGDSNAQISLGELYRKLGDVNKAFEWIQKAAQQGNANGQFNLGVMYAEGESVPKDFIKAFEWYQKAAEQGLAEAQFNVGVMYNNGEGVSKDDIKAVEWYQKAAEKGVVPAQYRLGIRYLKGEGLSKDSVRAYAWFNLASAQGNFGALIKRNELEMQLSNAERMEGQRLASNWKKGDNLLPSNTNVKQITPANQVPTKQATGTAFTVSSAGHALTNHHVIKGCTEVKISGLEGLVKVITSDSVNDLALLQLPRQIDNYAKLNPDTGKLRQGEDIIVFGYPLNFALSSGGNLTPGTLSALTGLGNNTNQIQITAPIQPGSSGSPVMDKKGDVVGVVSMKLDDGEMTKLTGQIGQNVSFAVNGQTVKAFLDANNVPYKTGGGFFSTEKNNADIADEARKWTVLVECWK